MKTLVLFALAASLFAQAPVVNPFPGATHLVPGAGTPAKGIVFVAGGPGGTITTSTISPTLPVAVSCSIKGYTLALASGDSGTVTVKFWKIATGSAVPTVANVISTSGLSISSGTAVASATVSDFTSVVITSGDMMVMAVTAVSGTVSTVTATLTCQ